MTGNQASRHIDKLLDWSSDTTRRVLKLQKENESSVDRAEAMHQILMGAFQLDCALTLHEERKDSLSADLVHKAQESLRTLTRAYTERAVH